MTSTDWRWISDAEERRLLSPSGEVAAIVSVGGGGWEWRTMGKGEFSASGLGGVESHRDTAILIAEMEARALWKDEGWS